MKKIVKNFNNLIKSTIFNVQNKTNNNLQISNFNKYLITFIISLFFYLFYLLIPLLYDKRWIQNNIESKLINEFQLNLSTSSEIFYHILPAPHFLIKDSKMLVDDIKKQESIAEIKNLKIYIDQTSFFDKEKINFKKIVIGNANFLLSRNNINLLNSFRNNQFPKKEIKIINSNIFFKDNFEEIISIMKINKSIMYFDDQKSFNLLNLNGEIFTIPFNFEFKNENTSIKKEEINFFAKSLKLKILNESIKRKDNSISGKNIISFANSSIDTRYDVKKKFIVFRSNNSKVNNSKIDYIGKLSINPFDLDLNIDLGNHKIFKLFNNDSILIEFIKSELLFNENISVNSKITITPTAKNRLIQKTKINFNIVNGRINFDDTKFINDSIGSIKLRNSNLFMDDTKLVLNADILIDIKSPKSLFSFLNTNKDLRKDFKSIIINLDYDFSDNQIKFNKVKIDNNDVNDQFLQTIEGFNNNNLNNFNKSRRLINDLIKAYLG